MTRPATLRPSRHQLHPRALSRACSPQALCQTLESRLLLSFAPSSIVGDNIIIFATAGTASSIPPSASVIAFSANAFVTETNLLSGSVTASTFTYIPVDNTATMVITEPTHLVNFTLNFTSAQSGTYTSTIADLLHPGSQTGIFVLNNPSAQTPAPSTIVGLDLLLNVAGGAGTHVVTSGSLDAQFYSGNTFTAIQTPVSGSPDASHGSFGYIPSVGAQPGLAVVQIGQTGNPTVYALLAFVSSGAGAFYLSDATSPNGENGSLTDYAFGTFNLAASSTTNTLITLGTSHIPAPEGASVILSASVLPNLAGGHIPTGTVTFKDGTTTLGTGPLDSTGVATYATTSFTAGIHPITAIYGGDANFSGSITIIPFLQLITFTHATNMAYVSQVYTDLLHRAPDGPGLDSWTNVLDSGSATLADVATALTSSREYDGIVVDAFYFQYLGRHSELSGLNIWVDQMQGGLNAEVIRAGILGSQEFYDRQGGTDLLYLTTLYTNFLGRSPDASGINYWTSLINNTDSTTRTNSRIAVSSGISNSTESRTDIATGFYESFLHRAPDEAGLAVWIANLTNGVTQPQIISFFVTTAEYLNLHSIT